MRSTQCSASHHRRERERKEFVGKKKMMAERDKGSVVARGNELRDEEMGNASVRTAETLLRILPMALCVTALVIMFNNSQTSDSGSLSYSNLGAFTYLVYANGICAAYSLLSAFYAAMPRSSTMSQAWTLFFFDQVLTYAILAAGTVSTELLYLDYKGDEAVTWSEGCGVFGGFCRKATASVSITFAAVVCYVVLSLISSYRLFSNYDAPPVGFSG